ncbi:MAG: hypothetical protein A4E44_01300 [Methanosaeta sp. PtaB.Bin018]|jgi:hypothetical protein|nr:hypothetical protein [Methanothrix sp.]OPX75604.1 MAG: hypothetical protein A4E44_01300 [Methanosaeta sp. PtaB.Bin018]
MPTLRGAADLAEYIHKNYSGRVVEVGVGHLSEVAASLMARGMDVVLTDRRARTLGNLSVEKEDIFSPHLELYQRASLIYSIRPPLELQIAIGDLAIRIGADVLIRPLGDEVAEMPRLVRRLVNFGEARFYIFSSKVVTSELPS